MNLSLLEQRMQLRNSVFGNRLLLNEHRSWVDLIREMQKWQGTYFPVPTQKMIARRHQPVVQFQPRATPMIVESLNVLGVAGSFDHFDESREWKREIVRQS